ncbi:MAG: DUF4202 family protein [Pseudomonadota bacterium]|nr:DUF4202 family protein [Pseudomonadota bacterium]
MTQKTTSNMSTENLEKALKAIDSFNRQDPRQEIVDGIAHPQELLYSRRLTEWVLNLDRQASEALRIAARGQHIGRWTVPRAEYPAGRSGYLRWRDELKAFHAEKVGGILRDVGYEEDFIKRVKFLILKNNIKEDTDAQTLEDALCLVFFETQFLGLMEKTPVDKMKTLVRKTWKKMGAKGREVALRIKLPFEEKRFLESTLSTAIYGQPLASLLEQTRPLRDSVATHRLYSLITDVQRLRTFMEHHVFAVWDFMSLVKALQKSLTCVSVPWLPRGDPLSRRLINEIVLDEESDERKDGGYLSHFEIYLQAMDQCGADTTCVNDFVERIRSGEGVRDALHRAEIPEPAREFVERTWDIIESQSPHRIAAAFTLGREEVIPEMFQNFLKTIEKRVPVELGHFAYYLGRHIHADADRHAPMALKMLVALCGEDPDKWREAAETTQVALQARQEFLDAITQRLMPRIPFGV